MVTGMQFSTNYDTAIWAESSDGWSISDYTITYTNSYTNSDWWNIGNEYNEYIRLNWNSSSSSFSAVSFNAINNRTPRTPQEKLRDILRSRHAPIVRTSRKSLTMPIDPREVRARETLYRLLGNNKFRRFLRDGFITIRGKSGLIYQIFPGHGITNVYDNGEKIDRLCVVLTGDFPPTDSVIMRYLLILNDEGDFRRQAIQHTVNQYTVNRDVRVLEHAPSKSLVELWRSLHSPSHSPSRRAAA